MRVGGDDKSGHRRAEAPSPFTHRMDQAKRLVKKCIRKNENASTSAAQIKLLECMVREAVQTELPDKPREELRHPNLPQPQSPPGAPYQPGRKSGRGQLAERHKCWEYGSTLQEPGRVPIPGRRSGTLQVGRISPSLWTSTSSGTARVLGCCTPAGSQGRLHRLHHQRDPGRMIRTPMTKSGPRFSSSGKGIELGKNVSPDYSGGRTGPRSEGPRSEGLRIHTIGVWIGDQCEAVEGGSLLNPSTIVKEKVVRARRWQGIVKPCECVATTVARPTPLRGELVFSLKGLAGRNRSVVAHVMDWPSDGYDALRKETMAKEWPDTNLVVPSGTSVLDDAKFARRHMMWKKMFLWTFCTLQRSDPEDPLLEGHYLVCRC
ncbi:hypothetical protein AAG570_013241 [Ranatra chinensis]|uniref:Uncharacterized protein n=1 Tax=Ranatra chinensis TaxID=642074 RepID=A0ABD0YYN1_9HEMI